jgi:hypothetical protein
MDNTTVPEYVDNEPTLPLAQHVPTEVYEQKYQESFASWMRAVEEIAARVQERIDAGEP